MKKWIKYLFQRPCPVELAAEELMQAKRELLNAQTARDYAEAVVSYNMARITRLESTLHGHQIHGVSGKTYVPAIYS